MGLSAGPVPSRVDACVKAGLLDLVDHAVDAGWTPRRAASSWASPELQAALADRDHDALAELTTAGQVPLLLAVSDNGPQMRSYSTREFMAALAIAQHFGRPSTPTLAAARRGDQPASTAWSTRSSRPALTHASTRDGTGPALSPNVLFPPRGGSPRPAR